MIYTEEAIFQAVGLYATFYGIEPEEVEVSRNYEGDQVIGFRLSRDVDGRQCGDDEIYGEWSGRDYGAGVFGSGGGPAPEDDRPA